ncbi:MAG: Sec-independent protein translocase protein TatB [Deltaproteobacteria bacterium]|nr:Sec-independent protein translocase protein TatB [Deltaproteobacteria bacterium]
MFDVGGSEILLILFLTLLVMGPKNIPKIARTLGKTMQQVRRITNEFKHAMEDEIRVMELEEIKAERASSAAKRPAEPVAARSASGDAEASADPPAPPAEPVVETVDPAAEVPVERERTGARPTAPSAETVARGAGDGGAP